MEKVDHVITISTATLLKILGFCVGIWFLYVMRDMVFAFFVAVILASLIDPFASWGQRYKIPRTISVLFIFALLFGLLGLVITLLVPLLIAEGSSFAASFGHLSDTVLMRLKGFGGLIPTTGFSLADTFSGASASLLATVGNAVRGVFSFLFTFVLTFYLVVEETIFRSFVAFVAPQKLRPRIIELVERMKKRLGGWLRAQLALSLIVGILVYIGLLILGVPYAALLAVLAAFLESVPYIGPPLSSLPAIFLALAAHPDSLVPALMTVALFVMIQQVENHILVPKIMQKAVGINPIVSIISIVTGIKLGGIIGGLIAIPAVTMLYVYLEYIHHDSV